MKKLMFEARPVGGIVAVEKPLWQGQVLPNGTVGVEDVSAVIAKNARLDLVDVQYVLDKLGVTVLDLILSGYNVDLDWLAFEIVMLGGLGSADSGFTKGKNRLGVRAHTRPPLRDCLVDVVAYNTMPGLVAKIQSLMDTVAKLEGTITVPSKVIISGQGLRIDSSRTDEGVALLTKAGEPVAVPVILANDAATLDLAFDALPPDGEYVLEVRARNGASADRAVAVARRNVIVSTANS